MVKYETTSQNYQQTLLLHKLFDKFFFIKKLHPKIAEWKYTEI